MSGVALLLGLLLGSSALAQDGADGVDAPRPSSPAADVDEEIVVIGEHVVADARARVVRAMEDLGWDARRRRRDGATVMRGPKGWYGKAFLLPTGDLEFGGPPLFVPGPKDVGSRYDNEAMLEGDVPPGTVGANFGVTGPRKLAAVRAEVRDAVHDEVVAWREAIQRRAFGERLLALTDRMESTWQDGAALDGVGPSLATPADRRAVLLDHWATRTDTREGRAVSRAVEIFLRQVVMSSDHPVTADERAAAEARRTDGRSLDLGDASP